MAMALTITLAREELCVALASEARRRGISVEELVAEALWDWIDSLYDEEDIADAKRMMAAYDPRDCISVQTLKEQSDALPG